MLWREDGQTLFVGVKENLDDYLTFADTVLYNRAKEFLCAEALVENTDYHAAGLVHLAVVVSVVLIGYLKDPEMLSEAVAIRGMYCADFVEVDPTLAAFHLNLSERQDTWCHSWDLEDLSLFGRYVGDFGPFASFTLSDSFWQIFLTSRLLVPSFLIGVQHHFYVEDGRDAKAECCARHQVSDDALVSLSLVDLSELFLSVKLYADAIL
jgi:hypothetical protein